MAQLTKIVQFLDSLLKPSKFNDFCPNGLQVEGAREVKKVVTGVTASLALIEVAIEREADLILVHHGYFWKGERPVVTGMKRLRLQKLLQNDISLIGYHLPLDAHPELGNNAQLAELLEIDVEGGFDPDQALSIGLFGRLRRPQPAQAFAQFVAQKLQRPPLYVSAGSSESAANDTIETIAWCTGGAQQFIEKAVDLQVDAYLTGEASEQTFHTAKESGIHFFAAGHHATERYGVKALGEHLADEFNLSVEFVDIPNPV